jgi:hypothetical protein
MATGKRDNSHWMERAFANAHGQLRKSTRTKSGRKISRTSLSRAAHSSNPRTKKRAVLARTAREVNARRHRRG